jgi:hypothetical protein
LAFCREESCPFEGNDHAEIRNRLLTNVIRITFCKDHQLLLSDDEKLSVIGQILRAFEKGSSYEVANLLLEQLMERESEVLYNLKSQEKFNKEFIKVYFQGKELLTLGLLSAAYYSKVYSNKGRKSEAVEALINGVTALKVGEDMGSLSIP